MFITSLSEAEDFVNSHSNIDWDGWDLVKYKKNPGAQFKSNGVYRNGYWYNKTIFPLNRDGWFIDERVVRENA